MYKLDVKDRKILYELDLNCRQSNAQIGKKVGLGRDVVAYRIHKLEEEGVITNYWTVIDTFKLGYNVFRVYLNFQDVSREEKQQLMQKLVDYKNSWAVHSIIGPIDLSLVVWVKNIYEFYNFIDKLLDRFGRYITQKIISVYVQADEYEKSYLLPDEVKSERKKFTVRCTGEKADIDEVDYKILNIIALNARIPLIELAEKVDTSSQTVNYRLNNMMKSGVIRGFRVNIDLSKLGLQYFDVRINLTDHSFRRKIIGYLEKTPYLKCVNTAFGYADLELELILENMDKLVQVMDELDVKFPRVIRNYHLLKIKKTYRERWLPELY